VGIEPDVIFGLAFAMFVTGVIGARTFYVIQYWDEIRADRLLNTLANIINVVGGGLVVYGSLMGAAVGFVYYARKVELPLLKLADLIAPSLALGLSLGRIGCLLNGCCFGGLSQQPWAMTFPADSPPYLQQKSLGMLYGFRIDPDDQGLRVREIPSTRLPAGLATGDRIMSINDTPVATLEEASTILLGSGPRLTLGVESGRTVDVSVSELPHRSLPVHPTQIYSSIDGFVLFLVALAYYPYRTRDGQVIAILLTMYAATRFLIEEIRTDETSILGTGLTISQNVSILMAIAMAALWWYILRQPRLVTKL
jgi:phosphatidylglycerol:prolipoprotein diacylglycerol transferase